MGEEGFSSDSSLLYHRGLPSAIVDATPVGAARPGHSRANRAAAARGTSSCTTCSPARSWKAPTRSPAGGWCWATPTCASPTSSPARPARCTATRSATSASTSSPATATVETVFGALTARQGDYVILPRATTHRWVPTGEEPLRAYAIEANSPHRPAQALPVPVRPAPGARPVLRARPARPRPSRCSSRARTSRCWSSTAASRRRHRHPLRRARTTRSTSSAGTAACTRTRSTSPTSSRSPAGCTSRRPCTRCSRATNFVICNFVPRKVDYHPLAIPVPYYHSNVDSDEVMFYCGGDYEARKGSGHRAGLDLPAPRRARPRPAARRRTSAPRRGVLRRARRHGRHLPARSNSARAAVACEDPGYAWTWSGRGPAA